MTNNAKTHTTLIKNARLITRGNETKLADLWIEDGKIREIRDAASGETASGYASEREEATANVYDAEGRLCLSGGVDAHVHLREPGYEAKETIRTGTMAALRGGYTSLMPMPNLKPHPDAPDTIAPYLELIRKEALVNVFPVASITRDSRGQQVVDMQAIKERFGINAFSDDGVGVQSADIMREAMLRAKEADAIIVAHTEDMSYRLPGSSVHDGPFAKEHGWIGIPSETEFKQVERDLALALETGAKYHICHMSTKESVAALRKYKALGADVTGEVTSHHLLLIDEDVRDPNFKMNPPLRSEEDRQALIEGLLDGTIDFIANDHAPHTDEEKARPMDKAPFGIVALETAIPLIYTHFVRTGIFTLEQFQAYIAQKPACRFGLRGKGRIAEGYDADLILLAGPDEERVIRKEDFLSKGHNTPFDGWPCSGYPEYTFVGGILRYENGVVRP